MVAWVGTGVWGGEGSALGGWGGWVGGDVGKSVCVKSGWKVEKWAECEGW